MQREIKFRAWDTLRKVMVAEGFHVIGEVTMFGEIDNYCLNYHEGKSALDRYNDIEIMQDSGFDDNLGHDAYEGDITDDGRIIVWHKGAFWLNQINGDGKFPLHFLITGRLDRKIIGNKWANPELLTPAI